MEDGKRWNRSLLHPLAYLRPSLSLENGVGASLPLVRVGWLWTDFRRVLAGTHSVPRRSLLTLFMEGALCGRSQPPLFLGQEPIVSLERKEGSPPYCWKEPRPPFQ